MAKLRTLGALSALQHFLEQVLGEQLAVAASSSGTRIGMPLRATTPGSPGKPVLAALERMKAMRLQRRDQHARQRRDPTTCAIVSRLRPPSAPPSSS